MRAGPHQHVAGAAEENRLPSGAAHPLLEQHLPAGRRVRAHKVRWLRIQKPTHDAPPRQVARQGGHRAGR
jgi:hypothetical protein